MILGKSIKMRGINKMLNREKEIEAERLLRKMPGNSPVEYYVFHYSVCLDFSQ